MTLTPESKPVAVEEIVEWWVIEEALEHKITRPNAQRLVESIRSYGSACRREAICECIGVVSSGERYEDWETHCDRLSALLEKP